MNDTLVSALRELLARQSGQSVELVETHLSWVLLAPAHAYKLKKPVRLPFVDFSSLSARRYFCEEELRLNRRFAPTLYLDVLPVRGSRTEPRLGGINGGETIDYVLRMRRFAQSALLSQLLTSGGVEPVWLDAFAQRLADWHASAPISASTAWGSPTRIARSVADVLAALKQQRDDVRLGRLSTWLQTQCEALAPEWAQRQHSGSVRECHGDLHAGNLALIDAALTPFDCIEFDPGLRWIDVMNDLAFLSMDLKAHGRPDLAFRFLDVWLQHSGDHAGLRVLHFYEVYRALVRAMTRDLAGGRSSRAWGPDYLAQASAWAASPRDKARLLITHGLSSSGKSTVASQLLRVAGAIRIRSDVERKRLFGLAPLDSSAALGLDIYTEEATRETFLSLRERARCALQSGYPVIVDAAFLRRHERLSFRALAAELGVPFSILNCTAQPDTLRRRVTARAALGVDASEAGVDVLERQILARQPLAAQEQAVTLHVATDGPVNIESLESRWRSARP